MTAFTPAAERYASDVVKILARHVPGWEDDPAAKLVILGAVARNVAEPGTLTELIVDAPRRANWRLMPRRDDPRRVRLHCFSMPPQPRNYLDIKETTNILLDALPFGSSSG